MPAVTAASPLWWCRMLPVQCHVQITPHTIKPHFFPPYIYTESLPHSTSWGPWESWLPPFLLLHQKLPVSTFPLHLSQPPSFTGVTLFIDYSPVFLLPRAREMPPATIFPHGRLDEVITKERFNQQAGNSSTAPLLSTFPPHSRLLGIPNDQRPPNSRLKCLLTGMDRHRSLSQMPIHQSRSCFVLPDFLRTCSFNPFLFLLGPHSSILSS